MATECEDLRLSLSLCSSSHNCCPPKLTLFPSATAYVDHEADEDARAWSPVSTLSSLSGKRGERDDNDGEEDGQNSGKKLRLSRVQTTVLEERFNEHNTLNPKQKEALATQLNLRPRQVEVWFQNRRARTKLKQTEVEYEYLKRWCQKLAEENKRLQREVGELRLLKSAAPSGLQFHASPPSTLSMCASCERRAVSTSNATTTTNASSPPLQLLPASTQNLWASYFVTRAS